MEPKLQEQLSTILETLNGLIASGTALAVDKAPIIIQQLLTYELVLANALFWIGIILFILGVFIFFMDELGLYGFFSFVGGAILSIVNWFKAYKIENMPELWLFDYLQTMVRTTC